MGNPPLIVGLLINGVAYAAIFIVVALLIRYFTNAAVWRLFLVLFLFIAAGLYIVFALWAGESTFWIVIEVVGVAIFGGMGLIGLFGSIWWIIAGWALHPLWDVVLHYLGPGRPFATGWVTALRTLHSREPPTSDSQALRWLLGGIVGCGRPRTIFSPQV